MVIVSLVGGACAHVTKEEGGATQLQYFSAGPWDFFKF